MARLPTGPIAAACWLLALGALRAQSPILTFDGDKPGTPPAGFTFAAWRQPSAGTWIIRRQGANNYLHHPATAAAPGFSLALSPAAPARDVEVTARFRLVDGGRAGGLVWRYQDDQNYYAALLDLGRGEIALWRVTAGNRVLLEVEDDLDLDASAWHALKVRHDDDEVRVYLGGIRVFRDEDRRGGRTVGAGRGGVIAQGDADLWVDDFRLAELPRGK